MVTNLATFIGLTVVLSGFIALSAQSASANPPQTNAHKDKNYFVPPPPPYTPSLATLRLSMRDVPPAKADAVTQPTPDVIAPPAFDAKTQQEIDHFDSEISNSSKEISKLLDL